MSTRQERLSGLRGATTVELNSADEIAAAAAELVTEILARNGLDADAVVSVIFSSTPDLDAGYPAEGARRAGLVDAPIMCMAEAVVEGSLARCIRVLVHAYRPGSVVEPIHVYLHGASALRAKRADPK